ncbi:auxin-induced protein X15-like [Herrania umbratica]|uniref:Auxin-induced protein X15-like n=1 Tax=Herrania umbratica TaxID=108875 RepID=A0A6J1AY87_9ROSI|nr:auxin-induced protein X15-like [Herrania umbratica]
MIDTMYSASKISWFVRRIGRSKSKKYYRRLEEEGEVGKAAPLEAREGYVAMYVGEEAKRYEVPIKYLSLPTFKELLMQSQEDYLDAKIEGPILISCTIENFDQLLKNAKHLQLDPRCSSSSVD